MSASRLAIVGISLLTVVSCSGVRSSATPASSSPVVASTPAGALSASHRVLVVANCLHRTKSIRYKPRRLIEACGGDAIFTLRQIHYENWTSSSAHAQGVQRYNSCNRYCGAGNLIDRHVSFRFFRPQTHLGQRVFACMVVSGGTDQSYTILDQQCAAACHVRGHISG